VGGQNGRGGVQIAEGHRASGAHGVNESLESIGLTILPRQFARVGHPLLGLRDGEALPFGEVAQGRDEDCRGPSGIRCARGERVSRKHRTDARSFRSAPTLDRVGHPLLGLRDGEALPFGEVAQGRDEEVAALLSDGRILAQEPVGLPFA
jgi:hypothetical protein